MYIYNNGAYNYVVDQEEVNLLFDYVPDKANCFVLANGNVLSIWRYYGKDWIKRVQLDVGSNRTISGINCNNSYYTTTINSKNRTIAFSKQYLKNDFSEFLLLT